MSGSAQVEERWCAGRRRKKKKKDQDSWVCREKGSFFGFFSFKFKTRIRVFSWEGWGRWEVRKIGIEGNRERIQIKTIVHLEGKDGSDG